MPARVFIIHGDETYYHQRLVRAIRGRTLTSDLEAFNYTFLEHDGATPGAAMAAVLTPPMMADHRLVVVRDPAGLAEGRRGPARVADQAGSADDGELPEGEDSDRPPGAAADSPREWASVLQAVPAGTRFVLSISRELPTAGPVLKSAAALSPAADVIRCFTATAKSAESWVRRMTAEGGGSIDAGASQALVARSGTSLAILEKEIEKLLAYTGDTARIKTEDVLAAATPSAEASVFELVDHIGSRRPFQAVLKLRRLIEQGELPLRLMAMVVRQVRVIFITREMLTEGANLKEVEERLRLPTWVVRGYLTQAKNFNRSQLTEMMRNLHRIDLDIKTGRQEPEAALEIFILRHGA